jgi:hypothetical protein
MIFTYGHYYDLTLCKCLELLIDIENWMIFFEYENTRSVTTVKLS